TSPSTSISPSLSIFFFFHRSPDPPHLHSFPTRRSSDLPRTLRSAVHIRFPRRPRPLRQGPDRRWPPRGALPSRGLFVWRQARLRSEEHTSELQSRGHLVCRLLLEKKKKKKKQENKV